MAEKSQVAALPLPSPAQIALALVTVRSKPPDLTVEEHLNNIRRCIVLGHARQGQQPPKRIDATRFWKDAFQRSQEEKSKLHEELSVLRQQVEKTQAPSKTAAKRKGEINVTNKANTHSKRKRTERETPDQDGPYHSGELERAAHPAVQKVLRAIFTVIKPKTNSQATHHSLLTDVQLLCRALRHCLSSASPHEEPAQNNSPTLSLAEICPILVSSHTVMFSALDSLNPSGDPTNDLPRAISSIVALFQALLDNLHTQALDETRRRDEEQFSKRRKPTSNIKAMKKSAELGTASFTLSTSLLVRTIQRVITALDLRDASHCHLFKSMLSALLDRIGSALSLIIFGDPQHPENGDTLVEQPRGARRDDSIDITESITTTEVEAPYLIAILRSVLHFFRDHARSLPLRSRGVLGSTLTDIDNDMLLQKIEKGLQDTLMQGVFGNDNDKFREAFTRPASPDHDDVDEVLKDACEEDSKSEWFVGQVWELLGWDILSGRMAGTKHD